MYIYSRHGRRRRHLDDEELDSGDVDGRDDRIQDEDEEAAQYLQKEVNVIECDLPRTAQPQPSDGEVRMRNLPLYEASC